MSKLNKETENEMIKYIEHLLKKGIYLYGNNNINQIARYLIFSGCRIHIGSKRKKYLEKIKNEGDKIWKNTSNKN